MSAGRGKAPADQILIQLSRQRSLEEAQRERRIAEADSDRPTVKRTSGGPTQGSRPSETAESAHNQSREAGFRSREPVVDSPPDKSGNRPHSAAPNATADDVFGAPEQGGEVIDRAAPSESSNASTVEGADGSTRGEEPCVAPTLAVAESLQSRVCVLNPDGRIAYVNRAWEDNLRRKGLDARLAGVGVSYLDVCARSAQAGDVIAAAALAGVEDVLAGRRDSFELDYPCADEEESLWFAMKVQRPEGAQGGVVIQHVEITDRKLLEIALEREAHYEPRTGLPKRAFFTQSLLTDAALCDGETTPWVYHVGVHEFDHIIRSFGHQAAEIVESALGRRLLSLVDPETRVASLGRGEFLVADSRALNTVQARERGEQIRGIVSTPVFAMRCEVHLRASVGVARHKNSVPSKRAIERGLRAAQIAFLEAQRCAGGSTCVFDRQLARKHTQRAQRQDRARRSLADKAFELCFQPIVGAVTRYPAAVETLLRRRKRDGGLESMGDTLLHLESSSSIVEIDRWVIEAACRQWVEWRSAGPAAWPFGVITVNTSPFHFQQPDFVPWLKHILGKTRMPPSRLALEVTERAYVEDEEAFTRSMEGAARLGVSIWVDDFGTGYSSFELLRNGWANTVKMDRSMAAPERYDHSAKAVIRAIVSLARHLGLRTVAEGVQTSFQAQKLDELKCDLQQGFFHARPMTAAALGEWVKRWRGKAPGLPTALRLSG